MADHAGRTAADHRPRCRLEIARALKRGITVIPVLVGGAGLPREADLPEDLKLLVDRHYAAISINGFRNEMAGLAPPLNSQSGMTTPGH